jgi:hypothetical protein
MEKAGAIFANSYNLTAKNFAIERLKYDVS